MNLVGSLVDRAMFPGTHPSYDAASFEELILLPFPNRSGLLQKIPCVLLPFRRGSPYLIVYAHGNGTDLGDIISRLELLSNSIQAHIVAFDYPGYGCFEGKADMPVVDHCMEIVIEFVQKQLLWPLENVILFGCSIGTGPCTRFARNVAERQRLFSVDHGMHQWPLTPVPTIRNSSSVSSTTSGKSYDDLNEIADHFSATRKTKGKGWLPNIVSMQGKKLGGLILQCPYRSIRHAAQKFIGTVMARLLVESRWNIEEEIMQCSCPVLWIHGKKDELFEWQGSEDMFNKYEHPLKMIHLPDTATHLLFDFNHDIVAPVRAFLSNMVALSSHPLLYFSSQLQLTSPRLIPPELPCPIPVTPLAVCPTILDVINTWREQQHKLGSRTHSLPDRPSGNHDAEFYTRKKLFDNNVEEFRFQSSDNSLCTNASNDGQESYFELTLPSHRLSDQNSSQKDNSQEHKSFNYIPARSFSTTVPLPIPLLQTPQNICLTHRIHSTSTLPSSGSTRTAPPAPTFRSLSSIGKTSIREPSLFPEKLGSFGGHGSVTSRSNAHNQNDKSVDNCIKTNSIKVKSMGSRLWPLRALRQTFLHSIRSMAWSMHQEIISRDIHCFINDYFSEAVLWVRRFYAVRCRQSFGVDIIYKRVIRSGDIKSQINSHSDSSKLLSSDYTESDDSTWIVYALVVAGIVLRLTGTSHPNIYNRGCLLTDYLPQVLGNSFSECYHTHLSNDQDSFSQNSNLLEQLYTSPDYAVFPIFTPSKDFIFMLARWLVLLVGTRRPIEISQPRLRTTRSAPQRCLGWSPLPGGTVRGCCDRQHSPSDKSDSDTEDSKSRTNRTMWEDKYSDYHLSKEADTELEEFGEAFLSNFCTQTRRPRIERLGLHFGNYFCFGWDQLIEKLFDDWPWFEPRISLITSRYLNKNKCLNHSQISLNSTYSAIFTSCIQLQGWKLYRKWRSPDVRRGIYLDENLIFFEQSEMPGVPNSLTVSSNVSKDKLSTENNNLCKDELNERAFSITTTAASSTDALSVQDELHYNRKYNDLNNERRKRVISSSMTEKQKDILTADSHSNACRVHQDIMSHIPYLVTSIQNSGGLHITDEYRRQTHSVQPIFHTDHAQWNKGNLQEDVVELEDFKKKLDIILKEKDNIDHFHSLNNGASLFITHPSIYSNPHLLLLQDTFIMKKAEIWMNQLDTHLANFSILTDSKNTSCSSSVTSDSSDSNISLTSSSKPSLNILPTLTSCHTSSIKKDSPSIALLSDCIEDVTHPLSENMSASLNHTSVSDTNERLQKDRKSYITACNTFDHLIKRSKTGKSMISSDTQSNYIGPTLQDSIPFQPIRYSICYHHLFHYVLMKPGFIIKDIFAPLDALWRLIEVMTGIHSGPVMEPNPFYLSSTIPLNNDPQHSHRVLNSKTPTSSQAGFLINISFGAMLLRRFLNLAQMLFSRANKQYITDTTLSTKSQYNPASCDLSPSLCRRYPGVLDSCVRFFDELRFSLLRTKIQHTDSSSNIETLLTNQINYLGYEDTVHGWKTGTHFGLGNSRLVTQLETLLAILFEVLETVDLNHGPISVTSSKLRLHQSIDVPLSDNTLTNSSTHPFEKPNIFHKKTNSVGAWWSDGFGWLGSYARRHHLRHGTLQLKKQNVLSDNNEQPINESHNLVSNLNCIHPTIHTSINTNPSLPITKPAPILFESPLEQIASVENSNCNISCITKPLKHPSSLSRGHQETTNVLQRSHHCSIRTDAIRVATWIRRRRQLRSSRLECLTHALKRVKDQNKKNVI